MAQVVLEARADRFRVIVRRIQRAVSLTGARHPGVGVRMILPVDPEPFFVEGALDKTGRFRMLESVPG